jgi:hypothetical protein
MLDAAQGDGDSMESKLPYVTFADGWSGDVYTDFSSTFTLVPQEFVDGAETYDNLPDAMFTLRAPYPEELCVVAGRKLLELASTGVIEHDFGNHAPNTLNLPDAIRSGVWASSVNGGNPAIVITSSSAAGGDGVFTLSTQWVSTTQNPQNNVRAFAWDPVGAFDAVGAAEGYMATANGVWRYSTSTQVFAGDTNTAVVVGSDMYLTRTITIDTDVRVIRVSSMSGGMYPEAQLAQATTARLGEGTPVGGVAWVVLDRNRLARITSSGTLETVATSTDADAKWYAAVTPPPGHPLATAPSIVYVLESNVAASRYRVLALHQ